MQAIVDINWALWLSTMAPLALSAGPGNLMVATSGAQSGVRHSLRFIAGLDLTYLLLALLMGLGLYHSLSAYPTLMRGLQIAGSAYIFWRGLRLLRASALDLVRDGRTTLEEINRVTFIA